MDGSLGHQLWQNSTAAAGDEIPDMRFAGTQERELEEGEIDPGDVTLVAPQDGWHDDSYYYSEHGGQAAVCENNNYGDANISQQAYSSNTQPAAKAAWPPHMYQGYDHSFSCSPATAGDSSIAEQTWPGGPNPSQGQAENYANNEFLNYSGPWLEGDQFSYHYSTPASNSPIGAQEARAYDYSAYYEYRQGHTEYGIEPPCVAGGFMPLKNASETDGQLQHVVPSSTAPNISTITPAEETASRAQPAKRTLKKPDKSKFVLSKNKPIVQPNFLPKLSSGAITKPRPKKVESKYEAEMRKYQAMA